MLAQPGAAKWAVLGQTLALHLLAFWQPVAGQALAAHDRCEPEVAAPVCRWVGDRTLVDLASTGATVTEMLATVWDDVSEAARVRDLRRT